MIRATAATAWSAAFAALATLAATACGGGEPDPCADVAGTCVAIRVTAADGADLGAIDQLELDILYGVRHATTSTAPDGGHAVDLPVITAITLADIAAEIDLGVVGAGKRGGTVLGTGSARTTITRGAASQIDLVLSPPAECVAGATYCGGDKIAGSADTLYECNGGGVPIAHGRCAHGCTTDPGADDYCDGGPEQCTAPGHYCGGNEVDGDPEVLYTCQANGTGTVLMHCATTCSVQPAGTDDMCE